jgi:hypothetical protein
LLDPRERRTILLDERGRCRTSLLNRLGRCRKIFLDRQRHFVLDRRAILLDKRFLAFAQWGFLTDGRRGIGLRGHLNPRVGGRLG